MPKHLTHNNFRLGNPVSTVIYPKFDPKQMENVLTLFQAIVPPLLNAHLRPTRPLVYLLFEIKNNALKPLNIENLVSYPNFSLSKNLIYSFILRNL